MLHEFAQSIADIKATAGWSAADYYNTMSNKGAYTLVLEHQAGYAHDENRPADTGVRDGTIVVTIYDYGINQYKTPTGRQASYVHEQAHVWDIASKGAGKAELSAAAGGYQYYDTVTGTMRYGTRDQQATQYSGSSAAEDWAETVAVSVYPAYGALSMGSQHTAIAQKYLSKPHSGGGSGASIR
jgi:hypothetical protein